MPTIKTNSSQSATASIKYARDSRDLHTHQKKLAYEGGINCDPAEAELDFSITRKLYRKTAAVQAHNIILSFDAQTDLQTAQKFSQAFCEQVEQKLGGGFQIAFYGHQNTDHLHSHIVINAVNLETGRKYHLSNDIQKFRQLSDQLAPQFGLELPQPTHQRFDKIERQMARKKAYYWKTDLKYQIQTVMAQDQPQSEAEFASALQKHQIILHQRKHNHQPIYMYEFIDQDQKSHKAKDFKLGGTDFEYGTLQLGFESNAKLARDQERKRAADLEAERQRQQLEREISGFIDGEYSTEKITQKIARSERFARAIQQKLTELIQQIDTAIQRQSARIQELKQAARTLTKLRSKSSQNEPITETTAPAQDPSASPSKSSKKALTPTEIQQRRRKIAYLRSHGLER